ncbi:MAG: glycosyltransferase family 9 protein [Rhodospirillales bacterium]|nr:glycosyltransferase family 9 protein [Rhodospirillales bacterium]MCB9995219.1 glycosyltransferase family 9 protein [Rhodospirillales bacterium]
MKVLFITSSRLGDAVLSTGLLDHIIKTYPQAEITVACGPLPKSLFDGMPGLVRVITLKKQKYHGHWVNLWKQVAGTRWDLVVDLRDSAVSRLIRARQRFIYGKHIDGQRHKVEQGAAVMKLDSVPSPVIWVSAEQQKAAQALIPDGGPVLGVGPTANWIGKTWPADRFIAVVEKLTAADGILPGARVAVFAAPGEEEDAYTVLNAVPQDRQIDVIAKTDPGTAAAALQRCALYIGNDSGLMHCAAAACVPTVGVFGPSYPHLYRPWGDHTVYARTAESYDELIDFDGYDPKTLERSLMTSLSVDDVMEMITDFWQARKQAA